jgi:hypothetical protein
LEWKRVPPEKYESHVKMSILLNNNWRREKKFKLATQDALRCKVQVKVKVKQFHYRPG